jgi:hypothetical protein
MNTYGATEATAVTTWHDVSESAPSDSELAAVPIGRPIRNTQVYILDRHLQPVPVGVPGELCIGGKGLARGYLGRADLTAERFVPDPFAATPSPALPHVQEMKMGEGGAKRREGAGARLYRSGDKARYRASGDIEFLGRMDRQVKIRGYRVELGEIEAAINQHPAVRESIVLARDGERSLMDHDPVPGKTGRLVAYVALAEARALTPHTLREFLRDKVPGYMLPSALVLLDALPHTPGGKLDPRALPAPTDARPLAEAYDAPPRTEIEQAIASVWREVLGVARVGLHDNFFDLGGHSLLVLRVQSKLQGALNRNISTIELFKYPTIRLLADHLADDPGKLTSLRSRPDHAEARQESLERQKQSLAHRRAFRQTRRKPQGG